MKTSVTSLENFKSYDKLNFKNQAKISVRMCPPIVTGLVTFKKHYAPPQLQNAPESSYLRVLNPKVLGACLVSCSQTLTDPQGLIVFSISAHAVSVGTLLK